MMSGRVTFAFFAASSRTDSKCTCDVARRSGYMALLECGGYFFYDNSLASLALHCCAILLLERRGAVYDVESPSVCVLDRYMNMRYSV